ncbi:hypothetical protein V3C99_007507 [Haemonchus contortus]
MLRHRLFPASSLSKEPAESEPLDLTVPKSRSDEHITERVYYKTAMEESGSQILMRLLQQQLLFTMFSRPELKVTREPERLDTGQRKKSEPTERKEKSAGSRRRSEANARERNRVQHLGDMFDRLKSVLPIELDVKISKLATLKIASAYIRYLGCILDAENICHLVESEHSLMLCICEARSCPKKL